MTTPYHNPVSQPRKLKSLLFAAAALATSAATCLGGDLVDIALDTDGWTMVPIAESGITTHIIASRIDYEASFTDIDVVLYERFNDDWLAFAYDPQVTLEDAMIDIANEFGLSDPRDGDWLIAFDEENVLDYVTPRAPFGKGFFVSDPLFNIADQIGDSEPLAEGAENAGLPAASSIVNTGSVSGGVDIGEPEPTGCGCEDLCIQNLLAGIADTHLADEDTPIIEIIQEQTEDILCPCYRSFRIPAAPTPWTAWVCTPWGIVPPSVSGICYFSSNASKLRTRVVTKYCFSCISGFSTVTWTQFQFKRGTLNVSKPQNPDGTCSPPPCSAPPVFASSRFWTPSFFGPACPRP